MIRPPVHIKGAFVDVYDRLTNAGDLNRSWAHVVRASRSQLQSFHYPTLDRELVRQVTYVFSRVSCDKALSNVFLYAIPGATALKAAQQFHVTAAHEAAHYICNWPATSFAVAKVIDLESALFERAAKTRNEGLFLAGLKIVSWENKTASDYRRFVNLALEAGAHTAAQKIAEKGAGMHRDDIQLQKQARILAPPKVIERTQVSNPLSHRVNRDWLKTNRAEYRGQWVALHDGRLLGSASSLAQLRRLVQKDKAILFTIV